jgi:hypothetical protein
VGGVAEVSGAYLADEVFEKRLGACPGGLDGKMTT